MGGGKMVLGPGFSVIIDGVLFIHDVKEAPPLTPIDIRGCTTTPAVDSEEELAAEKASIFKKSQVTSKYNSSAAYLRHIACAFQFSASILNEAIPKVRCIKNYCDPGNVGRVNRIHIV